MTTRAGLVRGAAELAAGVPSLTWQIVELAGADGDVVARAMEGWQRLTAARHEQPGWTYGYAGTDTCLVYNGLMTELAILAREVGVHERTLRRAVAEGSLRGVRPSPRTLAMSLSEREYVRRSWRLLSALRAALRTEHNVRFALLFGSAARGTDAPGSDVDVLVSLRDQDLERIVELSAKLTAATGRRVDVVRLEDAESEPSFLADVVADGRVLVDRGGLWPRLRSRESSLRRTGRVRQAERTGAALAGLDRLLAP